VAIEDIFGSGFSIGDFGNLDIVKVTERKKGKKKGGFYDIMDLAGIGNQPIVGFKRKESQGDFAYPVKRKRRSREAIALGLREDAESPIFGLQFMGNAVGRSEQYLGSPQMRKKYATDRKRIKQLKGSVGLEFGRVRTDAFGNVVTDQSGKPVKSKNFEDNVVFGRSLNPKIKNVISKQRTKAKLRKTSNVSPFGSGTPSSLLTPNTQTIRIPKQKGKKFKTPVQPQAGIFATNIDDPDLYSRQQLSKQSKEKYDTSLFNERQFRGNPDEFGNEYPDIISQTALPESENVLDARGFRVGTKKRKISKTEDQAMNVDKFMSGIENDQLMENEKSEQRKRTIKRMFNPREQSILDEISPNSKSSAISGLEQNPTVTGYMEDNDGKLISKKYRMSKQPSQIMDQPTLLGSLDDISKRLEAKKTEPYGQGLDLSPISEQSDKRIKREKIRGNTKEADMGSFFGNIENESKNPITFGGMGDLDKEITKIQKENGMTREEFIERNPLTPEQEIFTQGKNDDNFIFKVDENGNEIPISEKEQDALIDAKKRGGVKGIQEYMKKSNKRPFVKKSDVFETSDLDENQWDENISDDEYEKLGKLGALNEAQPYYDQEQAKIKQARDYTNNFERKAKLVKSDPRFSGTMEQAYDIVKETEQENDRNGIVDDFGDIVEKAGKAKNLGVGGMGGFDIGGSEQAENYDMASGAEEQKPATEDKSSFELAIQKREPISDGMKTIADRRKGNTGIKVLDFIDEITKGSVANRRKRSLSDPHLDPTILDAVRNETITDQDIEDGLRQASDPDNPKSTRNRTKQEIRELKRQMDEARIQLGQKERSEIDTSYVDDTLKTSDGGSFDLSPEKKERIQRDFDRAEEEKTSYGKFQRKQEAEERLIKNIEEDNPDFIPESKFKQEQKPSMGYIDDDGKAVYYPHASRFKVAFNKFKKKFKKKDEYDESEEEQ